MIISKIEEVFVFNDYDTNGYVKTYFYLDFDDYILHNWPESNGSMDYAEHSPFRYAEIIRPFESTRDRQKVLYNRKKRGCL